MLKKKENMLVTGYHLPEKWGRMWNGFVPYITEDVFTKKKGFGQRITSTYTREKQTILQGLLLKEEKRIRKVLKGMGKDIVLEGERGGGK